MDVFELLAKHGIDVAEDKREGFRKDFFDNFKTASEVARKAQKLEEANGRISELEAAVADRDKAIEGLKSDGGDNAKTIEELQAAVQAYKDAEAKREAEAKAASERAAFDKLFAEALGNKEFAADLVRESVGSKSFEMHKANPAMGIADIIAAVTEGQDGIWKNPQTDPKKMPVPGQTFGDKPTINSREDIKKLTSKQINENWETIQKILAN